MGSLPGTYQRMTYAGTLQALQKLAKEGATPWPASLATPCTVFQQIAPESGFMERSTLMTCCTHEAWDKMGCILKILFGLWS